MKKLLLVTGLLFATANVISQNVGIGITTPAYPLSFPSTPGDKISLYGSTGNHYGFGIQSGLLQIHTDLTYSDIALGHGHSSAFTERMRIVNYGGDGMLLNGRMVLKNGTNPLDPAYGTGLWMYKADNSAILGFMGVQDNNNLGFYGGPAAWGFTYDAINSRVGINNNNPVNPLSVTGNADVNGNLGIGTNSPVNKLSVIGNSNISGNLGLGTNTPANRLDVTGLNNWDLTNTEGDMRIGNSSHRLKFGVALSGGGAGAAGIMQTGGVGSLTIGANNKQLMQLNGAANFVDFTNISGGMRINGDAGTTGQVLESRGSNAAPDWKTKPYFLWLVNNNLNSMLNTPGVLSLPIPGMDNQSIFIQEPSRVMANISAKMYAIGFPASGGIRVEIWESSTNTLKLVLGATAYTGGYDGTTISKMDLIDLNAGFHQVRVYHSRESDFNSGDTRIINAKLIMQVFPN